MQEPKDPAASNPAGEILVRRPGEGVRLAVAGDFYAILAFGSETGGTYGLVDGIVPPGGGPPPHIQTREHEAFYVIEGELVFTGKGGRVVAGPGTFLNVPPGALHSFKNESDRPARILFWVAPGGLERMFEAIGQPFPDASAPIPPPTAEGIEKLRQIAPEYGVEVHAPEGV